MTILRAKDRFHTVNHWLDSWHSFSFGRHYHPSRVGFRSLLVINDDIIAASAGFGTHPHDNMEIFTYVLSGALAHKDSMGNERVLRRGDIQRMSAGTGITHSEFNPSDEEPGHLLQIWIAPNERGLVPSYDEAVFTDDQKLNTWLLMLSPEAEAGSVHLNQDAKIYASILRSSETSISIPLDRYVYVHVATGEVTVNDSPLSAGDGLHGESPGNITCQSDSAAELILFDLA